jgi:hypothetical protein
MMDPRLLNPQHWLRVADQRLVAAQFLFDNRFFLDSAYIAGYVVECALKGVVMARTPLSRRREVIEIEFGGRRGHDYHYLQHLLRLRGVSIPPTVADAVRRMVRWSTDLRYTAGHGDVNQSRKYLESGRTLLEWATRSI